MEQRIEKKFIFLPGDQRKIDHLKIQGFFKKIFFNRRVNSIYYDMIDLNCLWDNINGYSNRNKYRVRWYDDINNSEVFFEKKTKINQTTQKTKISLGKFKDKNDLNNFLKTDKFINKIFEVTSLNLDQVLSVSYNRDYYIDTAKKLRITFDQKIKTHQNSEGNFFRNLADLNNNILEFKYSNENSEYVRNKMYNLNFNVRNQKFSKYVQSFMVLNEMGHN